MYSNEDAFVHENSINWYRKQETVFTVNDACKLKFIKKKHTMDSLVAQNTLRTLLPKFNYLQFVSFVLITKTKRNKNIFCK